MTRLLLALSVLSMVAYVYCAGDEDVFEKLPEIHHVFRQPQVMPAAWFSKAFSLIVLLPWIIVLGGWLSLGITPAKVASSLMKGPSSGPASIVAFLVSLASIEYLFFLYWTQLNLFQTLGYLSVLSIFAIAIGQRALSIIQSVKNKH
ncbi:Oligosaccharyltransferase subunit Ribophorin II-domain-containing protein [Spinellus fusiger]|nr:Oligosaccharyltransferase subunit Ribophorin II-domain-containing protein [Spinellus fusiger]